jgi:hypothetical protein
LLMHGRSTILITHSVDLASRADRVVAPGGSRSVGDGALFGPRSAGGHFADLFGPVAKLRLKPPSDTAGGDGESSLPGGRFAAATKTASKA